jgi:DNA-binding NtrC family response regulator
MMPKVLFIDDEPYILDAYLRMLRNSIFECDTLSDSRALCQYPALSEVDIVVVDHQMPGVSGTDILLLLQRDFPHIKRVLVSGDLDFAQKTLSTTTLDAAIEKPFTKAKLLDCLLTLI